MQQKRLFAISCWLFLITAPVLMAQRNPSPSSSPPNQPGPSPNAPRDPNAPRRPFGDSINFQNMIEKYDARPVPGIDDPPRAQREQIIQEMLRLVDEKLKSQVAQTLKDSVQIDADALKPPADNPSEKASKVGSSALDRLKKLRNQDASTDEPQEGSDPRNPALAVAGLPIEQLMQLQNLLSVATERPMKHKEWSPADFKFDLGNLPTDGSIPTETLSLNFDKITWKYWPIGPIPGSSADGSIPTETVSLNFDQINWRYWPIGPTPDSSADGSIPTETLSLNYDKVLGRENWIRGLRPATPMNKPEDTQIVQELLNGFSNSSAASQQGLGPWEVSLKRVLNASKAPNSQPYFNPQSFQIISAGRDKIDNGMPNNRFQLPTRTRPQVWMTVGLFEVVDDSTKPEMPNREAGKFIITSISHSARTQKNRELDGQLIWLGADHSSTLGDGVSDSIWMDLGFPMQEAPSPTRSNRMFVKFAPDSADADDRPTEEVAFYYNKIAFGRGGVYDYPGEYATRFDGIEKSPTGDPYSFTHDFRSSGQIAWTETVNNNETITIHTNRTEHGHTGSSISPSFHREWIGAGGSSDSASAELIRIHAQYDMSSTIEHDDSYPFFEQPQRSGTSSIRNELLNNKYPENLPDDHGRVKVQFHWDQEPNAEQSLITIYTRSGFISTHPVTPGTDLPYGFSTDDLNDQMPPFSLPGNKTISGMKSNSSPGGGGYNTILKSRSYFSKTTGDEASMHSGGRAVDLKTNTGSQSPIFKGELSSLEPTFVPWSFDVKMEGQNVPRSPSVMLRRLANPHSTPDNSGGTLTHEVGHWLGIAGGLNRLTGNPNAGDVFPSNSNASSWIRMSQPHSGTQTHSVGVNEAISVGAAQEITVGGLRSISGLDSETEVVEMENGGIPTLLRVRRDGEKGSQTAYNPYITVDYLSSISAEHSGGSASNNQAFSTLSSLMKNAQDSNGNQNATPPGVPVPYPNTGFAKDTKTHGDPDRPIITGRVYNPMSQKVRSGKYTLWDYNFKKPGTHASASPFDAMMNQFGGGETSGVWTGFRGGISISAGDINNTTP